jgi:hypothetical protein
MARSASNWAWVVKPLVRLSKLAGASVAPDWLLTAGVSASEMTISEAKNAKANSLRTFMVPP